MREARGADPAVNGDELRDLERASIRAFVESCADDLGGAVLDLGCGREPYRQVIEAAGGTYTPFDRARFPGNVSGEDIGAELHIGDAEIFDAVLSTQVVQYVDSPVRWLAKIQGLLKVGGVLVLTGPTNWPVVEDTDLWRFTPAGARRLLHDIGFDVVRVEPRAVADGWLLGWGAVARA